MKIRIKLPTEKVPEIQIRKTSSDETKQEIILKTENTLSSHDVLLLYKMLSMILRCLKKSELRNFEKLKADENMLKRFS